MNHRERIKTAIHFEKPDGLPCHETPWEQTLTAWRKQGLPADIELADYFDFDLCFMYLDTSPRFDQKILSRQEGWITYEDRFGYTLKKADGIASTIHFIRHKTVDQQEWSKIKSRFTISTDLHASARIDDTSYFGHFNPYPSWEEATSKYQKMYETDRYLLFMFYGPWEATWRHRGMENLLMDVALESDWVREMAQTYQKLVMDVLTQCLNCQMKPDGIFLAEDLGCSTGPLMAPASWEKIFKPDIADLGNYCKKNDIDFWMHSDGAITPLIDHFVDCGVQVLNPLEAKAGMDVVNLRKRYGKNLAFFGNIDITKMAGSKRSLAQELIRKIPIARDGGYIMHSDHSCPPQVSLAQYCWMLQTARDIFTGKDIILP